MDLVSHSISPDGGAVCEYIPGEEFTDTVTDTYLLHGAEFSWHANVFSASQEIHRILWNSMVHYRIHKCPPPVSILS